MSKRDELLTSVTELVEQLTKSENESVEKSEDKNEGTFDEVDGTNTSLKANDGGDVIKNKDKKDDKIEKLGDDKKKKDPKVEDDEDSEEEMKKKKGAKKSMEDTKEEVKLEKSDKVEITAAQFEFLQKAMANQEAKDKEEAVKNDPIYKSVEGLNEVVKALSEKIDTMSKAPSREPKSLNNLKVIEKSEGGDATKSKIAKSTVIGVLLDLQKSGEADAVDVIEYENSKSLSNKEVKNKVESKLREKGLLA